jgi:CBS domain-containing protein
MTPTADECGGNDFGTRRKAGFLFSGLHASKNVQIASNGVKEMLVQTILDGKGSEVVTTTPMTTLEAGIRMLAERGIGALLILDARQRVIGILSERDVVRALDRHGPGVMTEPLARAMTHNVSACTREETVNSVMERMTAGRFRHMPVIDEGQLVGIVSIGDAVKHRVDELKREALILEREKEVLQHEAEELHHQAEVLQHETEELHHYIQSA